MPVIQTADLIQGQVVGDNFTNDQVYNALDCALTLEIFEELCTLGNTPPEVYSFSRALQAPCLAAMRRGFLVDNYERQRALGNLRSERTDLMNALQRMAYAVWDRGLNPSSTIQLRSFFYDAMRLPKQYISIKGVRSLSMNREVMEKLQDYFHAMPIAATILAVRDLDKQIQDFEQLLDSDGRYRTSFNIAGTESFRFSSSKSSTGSGGNLQNKKRDDDIGEGELSLRRPFIADPGFKLCEIDLEQAESREVGWLCWMLFGDESYLKSCESGDLHTTVCQMTWPDMAWAGTASDRKIAEQIFYRNYSYRDMAKKLGHGSNYFGTAYTMSRQAKIPLKLAQEFQSKYFHAFPGIPKWHRWTAQQLQTKNETVNSFGVARTFFGRANSDETLREAIAYSPQSSTAMRTNLAWWRIWNYMPEVELLAQKHDSITFQFPEELPEQEIISRALALFSTPLHHNGRAFDVPGEAKSGWNWGKYDEKLNPDGMKKFKGIDNRKRHVGMERIL